MNEKVVRALADAGAVKKIRIIANGSVIYVEVATGSDFTAAQTNKGSLKTWATIDSAARWIRRLGLGTITLEVSMWHPEQKKLNLSNL